MYRGSSGGFFPESKKPDLTLAISRYIDELSSATPANILSIIDDFLLFYENARLKSAFYSEAFKESWCSLISQHSQILTHLEFALGEQVSIKQLNPFDQLLGIYYLALALQEDSRRLDADRPVSVYSKTTLDFLHKAVLSSIQAILLLRVFYFAKLKNDDEISNYELDNFKTMAFNSCKAFKSPGYLVYGELLMHICLLAIKKKLTRIGGGGLPDPSPNMIYDLFSEAVLNIFIADFLQKDSANEINNAFMVSNGKIPYPEAFLDVHPQSADQYCRLMRKNMGLAVDINAIKEQAKIKVAEMLYNSQTDEKVKRSSPMI